MAELDPFSALTTGIESRLRLFFLKKIWEFHVVPDPLSVEQFKTLVGTKTPMLALSWRQLNPGSGAGRRFTGNAGLRLTIAVKNPKRKERFLGDVPGSGLYPAMAGAIALLNGFTVPDVGTLMVTACAQPYAEGFSDLTVAIATLDLSATIVIGDATGDLATAPDFLKLVSAFEPWPEGQDPDAPIDVRPAP